jgi:hypothetical protein
MQERIAYQGITFDDVLLERPTAKSCRARPTCAPN